MKLITDTCSVIKLLTFGSKLFQEGLIPLGDLVIHSRVFRETKKWPQEKKIKYEKELSLLPKIKNNSHISKRRQKRLSNTRKYY